jgi:hypothetical protein
MDKNSLRRTPIWAVTLILLLCIWTCGCQTRAAAADQQFRMLFDGFQLVLVDDLPTKTPVEELDSSALQNTYPTERTLTPGRIYSFRKTATTSGEDLGMKVLPARLGKIGARVTKAPQSSKDFMYPYVGGPLFVIQFEKDGHQGTIFNRVHTSTKPGEHWEELLVAYK